MGVNKVVYGGNTLVDLTADNVAASDVVAGKKFHLPNGNQAVGTLGFQILEFTLATHQSTDVTIGTLSDEAYLHIDDQNFIVTMVNTTPESVVVNDDYRLVAHNNQYSPAQGSYPVYGCCNRKATATTIQSLPVYYPPNSTDNKTSLGGIGKIWHGGKTLYYKSNGYSLGAGTYRVVITW